MFTRPGAPGSGRNFLQIGPSLTQPNGGQFECITVCINNNDDGVDLIMTRTIHLPGRAPTTKKTKNKKNDE